MSHGHKHDPLANTQNQGNTLGDRSCVRQSKLYRKYESGNDVKSILGSDNLCWDTEKLQGAYKGQRAYDHNQITENIGGSNNNNNNNGNNSKQNNLNSKQENRQQQQQQQQTNTTKKYSSINMLSKNIMSFKKDSIDYDMDLFSAPRDSKGQAKNKDNTKYKGKDKGLRSNACVHLPPLHSKTQTATDITITTLPKVTNYAVMRSNSFKDQSMNGMNGMNVDMNTKTRSSSCVPAVSRLVLSLSSLKTNANTNTTTSIDIGDEHILHSDSRSRDLSDKRCNAYKYSTRNGNHDDDDGGGGVDDNDVPDYYSRDANNKHNNKKVPARSTRPW